MQYPAWLYITVYLCEWFIVSILKKDEIKMVIIHESLSEGWKAENTVTAHWQFSAY